MSQYQSLGASANKKGLHQALENAGIEEEKRYFARIGADIAGDPNFASFIHCDGAGTKAIPAYLLYKETGSVEHFSGLSQDALVMNLDDIYCLGEPDTLLLANTIARNAKHIGDDALSVIIQRYRTLCEELKSLGISIELSGGETADMGDVVRTLVVDAVLCGRIKKSNLISTEAIIPGDVIVGFSSTGKSSYEKQSNSGIGSNGLTLARHCLISKEYLKKFPEIVDPATDSSAVYRGPFKVTDTPENLGMSVGEALLSPTRTFAPVLKKAFQTLKSHIHGAIHVTGGGLTKVLRFGKGNLYIKDDVFDVPPLFSLIQRHGNVEWKEMYQVFNMGQRLEVYLPKEHAKELINIASSFNIDAKIIGRVEKNNQSSNGENAVRVITKEGTFDYKL